APPPRGPRAPRPAPARAPARRDPRAGPQDREHCPPAGPHRADAREHAAGGAGLRRHLGMTSPVAGHAPAPIRVLVVDDSTVVRRLVTAALDADPGLTVVGQAADGHEAID